MAEEQNGRQTVLCDYPAGWEKALTLLERVPEERREAYLRAYLSTIMSQ